MIKYNLKEARIVLREGSGLSSTEPFNTPEDAVRQVAEFMQHLDREYVMVINLDLKKRPINYSIVSIGDLCNASLNPSNVFKAAILSNAPALMVMHNHPSGDTTPSEQDITATKTLVKCGSLLGITVLDHIIVGAGAKKYLSLREIGAVGF